MRMLSSLSICLYKRFKLQFPLLCDPFAHTQWTQRSETKKESSCSFGRDPDRRTENSCVTKSSTVRHRTESSSRSRAHDNKSMLTPKRSDLPDWRTTLRIASFSEPTRLREKEIRTLQMLRRSLKQLLLEVSFTQKKIREFWWLISAWTNLLLLFSASLGGQPSPRWLFLSFLLPAFFLLVTIRQFVH